MMTSKERINAALSHRQPDRIPFFEYVLMSPIADAILGRNYIDFCGDYSTWEKFASEVGWEQALRSTFASIPWEPIFERITRHFQTCIKFEYFYHFRQISFSVNI